MFALAACLVACDTPQKRGLRELARAGVEPSGLALLDAVNTRDSQRVGWLLDVGVYTEQQDPSGRTPVRIAIDHQDLSSVVKLLNAKANVNATTADGVSVLGSAVGQGETAIINSLLSAGARSDGLMPDGEKILPWAIRNGQLASVRAMLKSSADPHLKDRAGNPLLHVAMESGRRDLMESLLQLGADPGTLNRAGETTLHLACRNGWMDALPRLAAAGADPNAPDRDGSTLLEQAIAAGNREQVRLLLKIGADPNRRPPSADRITPLERVFFKNANFPLFQVFLDRGVLPPEGKWDPWLRRTYDDRNLEAARFLLNHGARATTPAPDGLLLMEAAAFDHAGSFVKLLADYGNPGGNSLWRAVHRGDRDMVSLLLACGVPVNGTRIPTRETLLSFAIRRKQDRIASSLVRNGADLTLLVPEGQAPLHLAIATACHRTVKSMLDAGADPNTPFLLPVSPDFIKRVRPGAMRSVLRHDRNFTPLMLAADSGVIPTTRHLLQAGAKKDVRTRSYRLWPLNFASNRGDVKMMRLMLGKDPQHEERHLEIRLSEQRARLFDAAGNELFNTPVSTGRAGFSTPTGEFVITDKNRDWTSTIYHARMPYFQRLSCGDFGLHQGSVPGYPASHGCIRVPPGNAAKLFTLTEAGDRVRILP